MQGWVLSCVNFSENLQPAKGKQIKWNLSRWRRKKMMEIAKFCGNHYINILTWSANGIIMGKNKEHSTLVKMCWNSKQGNYNVYNAGVK